MFCPALKLTQRVALTTVGAFTLRLARLHKQSTALGARLWQGLLPTGPFTLWIVLAAIESTLAACLLHDQVTATVGALDTHLLQNLLRIAALGEVAAADESAVTAVAVEQRFTTLRTGTSHLLSLLNLGHILFGYFQIALEIRIEFGHNRHPGFALG